MTSSRNPRPSDLLVRANRLKTTPRTGWAQRGVRTPESVADHSHGVALAAMLLLDLVEEDLDRGVALAMAVGHDLPEAVTGDLSLGASRLLPAGVKAAVEATALDELLAGQPFAAAWRARGQEYEAQQTPEARLVRDADRLDLLVQALAYERSTGTRELEEFWRFAPAESFTYDAARRIAKDLAERRP